MQTIRVTILDDLGQPELEGTETFELVLRMPLNGILGEPAKAKVFITDSVSDCKCCLCFLSPLVVVSTFTLFLVSCLFKDIFYVSIFFFYLLSFKVRRQSTQFIIPAVLFLLFL